MRERAVLELLSDVSIFWQDFPAWIRRHRSTDGDRSYCATAFDACSRDGLNLVVEISDRDGLLAISKCKIVEICGARKAWFVFSPLVVQWEQGHPGRGPETGQTIVKHLVSAVQSFRRHRGTSTHDILIASGNLTVAKAGRPFFERLGWQIVFPQTREPAYLFCGQEGLAEPLDAITAEIEAAIAPLLAAGRIQPEPICFAMLQLTDIDAHPMLPADEPGGQLVENDQV